MNTIERVMRVMTHGDARVAALLGAVSLIYGLALWAGGGFAPPPFPPDGPVATTAPPRHVAPPAGLSFATPSPPRSEEHTSELQSH